MKWEINFHNKRGGREKGRGGRRERKRKEGRKGRIEADKSEGKKGGTERERES